MSSAALVPSPLLGEGHGVRARRAARARIDLAASSHRVSLFKGQAGIEYRCSGRCRKILSLTAQISTILRGFSLLLLCYQASLDHNKGPGHSYEVDRFHVQSRLLPSIRISTFGTGCGRGDGIVFHIGKGHAVLAQERLDPLLRPVPVITIVGDAERIATLDRMLKFAQEVLIFVRVQTRSQKLGDKKR